MSGGGGEVGTAAAAAAVRAGGAKVLIVPGMLLFGVATVLMLIGGAGANADPTSSDCGGAGTGQTIGGIALTAEQMGNAQTIVSTTAGRNLPVLAAVVAVDTAYTESTLQNSTTQRDHDSEGLFQQRVSIYTKAVADDPVKSTNAFLDRLVKLTGWQSGSVGADAQAVQGSGHPERYQPNAALAQQIVGQLWGTANTTTTAATISTGAGGSATSTQTFFTDVLTKLKLPTSPGNLNALYAVAQLEGQNDRYNPLNSVITEPGSSSFNSVGVQRYASFDSGVDGTVALLQGTHWNGVRAALAADPRNGGGTTAVLAAFQAAYTWDPHVHFPTTNLATVAARNVGPTGGSAPICPGGGGAVTGGTPAGDIVGPTGNNIAGTTTVPAGLTLSGSAKGNTAVQYALKQLGKPYVFGASGPDSFDCSGLTMAAWAAAGLALPHFTGDQVDSGSPEPTNLTQAVSGDLILIPGSLGTAADPGHVGMVAGYVDRSVDGRDGRHLYLVQAPETGVPVELTEATEWSDQIVAVRHIG
ncbi:C40 family peptidase [uncultured Jatrophihabitans sp.]|uniref:C40 family peptidase n=1 Tax=uncultured Jatrophihabitans sp. TaxID=1610747 RepID=UPI0035CB3923